MPILRFDTLGKSAPTRSLVSLLAVSFQSFNQTHRDSCPYLPVVQQKYLRIFVSKQQRDLSSAASKRRVDLKFDLSRVHACEELLDYRFRERLLLWEALQPKGSAICETIAKRVKQSRYEAGNKRLAIVGDELMDVLLSERWYRSGESAYDYNKLRQQQVSNAAFRAVAKAQRLDRFMTKPVDAQACAKAAMSDVVEAIVGAVYLDGGIDAARKVVTKLGILRIRNLPVQVSAEWAQRCMKVKPEFFHYSNQLLDDY
ncbi:MAG: hypothetical protein Q9204_005609 [Flavoplaca sp. TL-2023a]